MLRILYFGSVVFTAFWLLRLLYRRFLAMRQVNVIVETPERTATIKALERAWSVDESVDDSTDPKA
ncbi:hypothetical protein KR100_07480 [Synechococcus sp. KORDI-100]|uniref:hypothetical protein n=1 Tax=Synechococcus sp. KORDI-100 TaxID=1280380 RepID=UPI0004E0A669|nr:hypothetical protein [Synechococcus sp. KORDI-100]AII43202.1 hypothetical protein KR100_07480 [Synechococcus sp. KORDI-100]